MTQIIAMDFLPELLEKYVGAHTKPEPEILKKLNRETHAEVMMPQMLSGHVQGRFLKMLCSMINPLQVLEIGTFTGYSSLCLAENIREGGTIHTIDINEELEETVSRFIKEAGEKNNKNLCWKRIRNYPHN